MPEFDIETIHSMLDVLASERERISEDDSERIDVAQYWSVCDIVQDLTGMLNRSLMQPMFGVHNSILNQFIKVSGTVPKKDALAMIDRLRSYLKSQDQKFVSKAPTKKPRKLPEKFTVTGSQWAVVKLTDANARKIAAITSMLADIIEHVNKSNAPPGQRLLNEVQKKQLITILETTLQMLKGPMIEKGMIDKVVEMLRGAAAKAVEKNLQEGLGSLMSAAGTKIGEWASNLF